MACPTVEIDGNKLFLLSGYRKLPHERTLERVMTETIKITALKKLRKAADSNPDAVAFGYVAGHWIAVA